MFIQTIGVILMKKCKQCNINVYDNETHCPLCYSFLGNSIETSVEYPKYEDILKEKTVLKNLPLFITLFVNVICLFINIFTHNIGDIIWSIIVVASTSYCLSLYYIIRNHMRHGQKILYSYLSLSLLLIVIDITSGCLFWSTDYVFPFLTITAVFYLTVLAVRNKRTFSEYFGFILAVTVIGFFSILMHLLGFTNSSWGAFVSSLVTVLLTLGLYLFCGKNLRNEINKRFHR